MKNTVLFLITLYAYSSLGAVECPPAHSLLLYEPTQGLSLPRNFRTSIDEIDFNTAHALREKLPSLQGLKELQISGSAQFSYDQIVEVIKRIAPYKLTVLDLREECHGFCNGLPVFWYRVGNDENKGNEWHKITTLERERIEALRGTCIKIYDEQSTKLLKKNNCTLTYHLTSVVDAFTEKELLAPLPIRYIRIPITDHLLPTDKAIDRFVRLVKQLDKQEWLHVHCQGGQGRTSIVLALYDIWHNAPYVSFEDILTRQALLGGKNLAKIKDEHTRNRFNLLHEFYHYASEVRQGYPDRWSAWKRKHSARKPLQSS